MAADRLDRLPAALLDQSGGGDGEELGDLVGSALSPVDFIVAPALSASSESFSSAGKR